MAGPVVASPTGDAVNASSSVDDVDGKKKTVDMNTAQTKTEAPADDKPKREPEQKDATDAKMISSSRYSTDIYGRVPGKEPKYHVPCPNCKRELAVSRFCQHLEKCMGLGGRGASSSTSGSQTKRRKSSM